ncbi:MAG: hypothetical protein HY918_03980 [Candidatus Doudnabacteria bacterium]|nr:hypothetical protein [Candidatus Doudnabacteria bacterium]
MQYYIRSGRNGADNHGSHPDKRKFLAANDLSPEEHPETIVQICKAVLAICRRKPPGKRSGRIKRSFQGFPRDLTSFSAALSGVGKQFGITEVSREGVLVVCRVKFTGGSIWVSGDIYSYVSLLSKLEDAKQALRRRIEKLAPGEKILHGISEFNGF